MSPLRVRCGPAADDWQPATSLELERVPGRSLPRGYQYTGFCGKRAQLRYLRQRFARVQKLRDDLSIAAMDALREALEEDPDPAFALQHLAHVALQAAEETGTTWAESIGMMLAKFEARASGEIA
jgi:hypothetical protein